MHHGFLKKLWYCIGGRVKQKFGFIKQVDKGWITTTLYTDSFALLLPYECKDQSLVKWMYVIFFFYQLNSWSFQVVVSDVREGKLYQLWPKKESSEWVPVKCCWRPKLPVNVPASHLGSTSKSNRPCHKVAILPWGTKKALFYHAKPHPHGFHCEA